MNDFASMVPGVRPLNAPRPQPAPRHQTVVPPPPAPVVEVPPRVVPVAPVWAIGADGMAVLERAMKGISRDGALRAPNGQIVMLVRRDGMLVDNGDPSCVATAKSLIEYADHIGCEMIVISWDNRKAVFHPTSGAAVLTENPKEG